ncbi:protein FAR1-related sequence 10-like [Trifolium pratense]|uniref:Protein FAR1-RELATED SEQUENCE n=1 Tax=Trifolium pratense TaxID=57577 RepID=A0A2K3MQ94_TRIPR|nr:protein FAR1-related sequence 10-like [Trifolium pratense]
MTSLATKNLWIRKQQCPCGDWKCYITYEGDSEEGSVAPESVKEEKISSCRAMIITPYVGMVFKSDDEAFEHYGNFARKNGFSIRKERSRISPQLGVYKRDFVCYRSGFAPVKRKANGEHQRDRKSVRCGCDAKMYLSKEVVDGVSQWFVVQFSNIHNHELLEDDQVRLLPAYRKIHEADQERILLLSKAGFPIHRIVKMLEVEKGIQGGHLPFLERDVRNFVQNRKKIVQENEALLSEKRENDVLELLEVCKAMKEADVEFVYDFTVDENEKVENIAWSYGDSVNANAMFGDDETPQSFAWALQAFLRFMRGRCPQTILSDLDPGLRDAVRSEFPGTKHVISVWNIINKVPSWFSLPLGSRYAEFKSEFNALFNIENTEEFELQWSQMISVFGLDSDKHIDLLYSVRASWAQPYVGISANFQRQSHQETQFTNLRTCIPIEEHARSILTPYAFNALQQELSLAMQYATSEMANGSYIIRHFKRLDGEWLVFWLPEDEQIHCSCKEFESSGILCRHALHVLVIKNYFQLPDKYYLSRWRRECSLLVEDENNNQSIIGGEWFQEYQSLAETLFSESSITKDRSDFVRKELTKELNRILNEVRNLPETDEVCNMNVTVSPNS